MKDYDERETTIRIGDDPRLSPTVFLWTCVPDVVRRLRRKGHEPVRVSKSSDGLREVGWWFEIPADRLMVLVLSKDEDLLDLPDDPLEWSLFAQSEKKPPKTASKRPFGGHVSAGSEGCE